jgi:hypothetical protein
MQKVSILAQSFLGITLFRNSRESIMGWTFKAVVSIIIGFFCVEAYGINCTTRIGLNGIYRLELSQDSNLMKVTTHSDAVYRGVATFSHSARNSFDYYFLPVSYNSGIEVRVDLLQNDEVWMCIEERVCGLCRP